MGRVIAVANQKGGVGKTTTAINLSASLALSEQRTLLIDCDPQGNTTSGLGFPKDPARRTLYNILMLGEPLEKIILKTQIDGLDLIPADKNLVGAEVELVCITEKSRRKFPRIRLLKKDPSVGVLSRPRLLWRTSG